MAIDKNITYDDPVVQGGVDNYLGKQPQVQAPRKWQSAPDKPATELAYITEAEKDLILKANIHGGLEGGPNMGPSGIMSLDSFGDVGGAGASGGDTEASGGAMDGRGFSGQGPNQSDRDFDRQKANQRAALQMAERAQAKNLGYNERANIATRTYGPLQKYSGDGFLGGYRNVDPRTGQPLSGLAYAFDKFNPLSLIAGLVGGPVAGLFARGLTGLTGLKDKFSDTFENFTGTMRGINPITGKPNTQAEYEAMVADRKTQSRIDNMTDRMLSGKNFSQKNLDSLLGQVDRYGNQFTNSVNSAINRDLDINPEMPQFASSYLQSVAKNLPDQKPTANITGTNLNDFEIGNPGKYATADMINEFGVKAGTADDSIANLSSLPGTADDRFANMYEDPFGNPTNDSRVVSEEMGLVGNQVPQGIRSTNPIGGVDQFAKEMEALEASLPMGVNAIMTPEMMGGTLQDFYTNRNLTGASTGGIPSNAKSMFEVFNDNVNFNDQASLPGNNMVAEITQKDIDRFKQPMTQMMDYDTYKSINTDSTLTPDEFNQLKAQV